MATPKELFLERMRGRNNWIGDPWSCFNKDGSWPAVFHAVIELQGGPQRGQMHVQDAWGVVKDWPAHDTGATPYITEETKVIKDITRWRDYVHFPDLDKAPWEKYQKTIDSFDRDNLLVMAPSFMGMFEFSHTLMGFEDALVNYLLEPEAMYELLSAYTDWKIRSVEQIIDHMQPDIIHSHDDWGNKRSLFLSPETWRELIKPHYARFYSYIKSRGVLVQHHADCVCHEIVEDMVELGIDMWQGVIPQNDIPGIVERTQGKLCLMGGFDMPLIDFADTPEEKIRAYVRQVVDTYGGIGNFIPCVTNIIPIHPHVERIIADELSAYGAVYAAK